MAKSGHIISHCLQHTQSCGLAAIALSHSSNSSTFFGQKWTQMPHALHHSRLIRCCFSFDFAINRSKLLAQSLIFHARRIFSLITAFLEVPKSMQVFSHPNWQAYSHWSSSLLAVKITTEREISTRKHLPPVTTNTRNPWGFRSPGKPFYPKLLPM
jgi:hypothetical protein